MKDKIKSMLEKGTVLYTSRLPYDLAEEVSFQTSFKGYDDYENIMTSAIICKTASLDGVPIVIRGFQDMEFRNTLLELEGLLE